MPVQATSIETWERRELQRFSLCPRLKSRINRPHSRRLRLILLMDDGLLVTGQGLLECQVESGVEALVVVIVATVRRWVARWWCCRLNLLLKPLLLLSVLLLNLWLLTVLLLHRLLWSTLLQLLSRWLLHLLPAHSLKRVVRIHHLQAVCDPAMCCCH